MNKPPLGVVPRKIWLEKRAFELMRAINDYSEDMLMHDVEHWHLIAEWSRELGRITGEITEMGTF